MTPSPDQLIKLLKAVEFEQLRGYCCLATVRAIGRSADLCPNSVADNSFLSTTYALAMENLIMALARLLDPDSAGIAKFCDHAEQNARNFPHLNSPEGQRAFPKGADEARERARRWKVWALEHELNKPVKLLRDKTLAHRDSRFWLGKVEVPQIGLADIEAFLDEVGRLNDDFRLLIDETAVYGRNVYDQVMRSTITMMVHDEVLLETLIAQPGEHPHIVGRISELKSKINKDS